MKTNKLQKNILSGWRQLKLVDIFEFKNGLNKEKKFFGQGTPIVNYMDINRGGGFYLGDIKGRVKVNKSEIERFSVRRGDVFFTRTSETLDEIGYSAVALDDFKETVFSGFILRARQKGELLFPQYAKYCFRTQKIRQEIKEKSSYTTRALTSGALLNHVNLLLPSLSEQKRIVSVLETWDRVIKKLEKKVELKKNIKKGLMQGLLTGKLRLPGFSEPWNYIKIKDLAELVKGDKSKGGENGYLEIGDVNISSKNYNIVGKEKLTVPGAIKVPLGTLLISTVRPTRGAITIVKENIFVSSAFCKLKINDLFIYFIVNSETFLNYLGDNSGGGTYPTCKDEDILEYEFLAPVSQRERIAVADILKKAEQEIEVSMQKINYLKDQKKYLLNNLITGAIRTPETMKIKS